MTPTAWLRALLTCAGSVRVGTKYQCPGHALTGEHSPSLSLGTREDGRAMLYCHAGCGIAQILKGLGLSYQHLTTPPSHTPARWHVLVLSGVTFPPPRHQLTGSLAESGYRLESIHPYGHPTAIAWKERYRHPSGAKEIRWESLNSRGERCPGLFGRPQASLPLYRLSEVLQATGAGERVILCESESSVDELASQGLYATTWCGAAGDPPLGQIEDLLGSADVLIVPDMDEAGLACAMRLEQALPRARKLIGLPGEDARDILKRLGPGVFL